MQEFTIVKNIRSQVMIFSGIFVKDIIILGVFCLLPFMIASPIFPPYQPIQKIVFVTASVILGIYLDLRPMTNPGKRNFDVIVMLVWNKVPTFFKSYGYYEFQTKGEITSGDELR